MNVHGLMALWAKETYSDKNSGNERRVFTACLERLHSEAQIQIWAAIEDPFADFSIGYQELVVDWIKESKAAHNSNEERGIYALCSKQLQGVL